MKIVKLTSSRSSDELIAAISDNHFVSDGVKFNDNATKPHMHVKTKENGSMKIRCEILGGPSKDNGFLEGTYFKGKITSYSGGSLIKGVIVTAPIFHLLLFQRLIGLEYMHRKTLHYKIFVSF